MSSRTVAIGLLLALVLGVSAQEMKNEKKPLGYQSFISEEKKTSQIPEEGSSMAIALYVFGTGILLFTGYVLWLQYQVLKIANKGWDERSFKGFMLTIIFGVGVFLVVAGYSSNQMAPITGIMGAVAGYLFGRGGSSEKDSTPAKIT